MLNRDWTFGLTGFEAVTPDPQVAAKDPKRPLIWAFHLQKTTLRVMFCTRCMTLVLILVPLIVRVQPPDPSLPMLRKATDTIQYCRSGTVIRQTGRRLTEAITDPPQNGQGMHWRTAKPPEMGANERHRDTKYQPPRRIVSDNGGPDQQ